LEIIFFEANKNFIDKPEVFDGAPVAIQIVGRRLQEEKTLALAEYIGSLVDSKQIVSSRL
jgi:Asp-tRNA(Asn)/Glu-tRNA(Gln) amidotransferase A subunit family amidase